MYFVMLYHFIYQTHLHWSKHDMVLLPLFVAAYQSDFLRAKIRRSRPVCKNQRFFVEQLDVSGRLRADVGSLLRARAAPRDLVRLRLLAAS